MIEAPLFIPLKTQYFEDFRSGKKTHEMRVYGPRWNEKTCRVGRGVVLSKGYGKQHRICGIISGFNRFDALGYDKETRQAILDCYGTLDKEIAHISIRLLPDFSADKEGNK